MSVLHVTCTRRMVAVPPVPGSGAGRPSYGPLPRSASAPVGGRADQRGEVDDVAP